MIFSIYFLGYSGVRVNVYCSRGHIRAGKWLWNNGDNVAVILVPLQIKLFSYFGAAINGAVQSLWYVHSK